MFLGVWSLDQDLYPSNVMTSGYVGTGKLARAKEMFNEVLHNLGEAWFRKAFNKGLKI